MDKFIVDYFPVIVTFLFSLTPILGITILVDIILQDRKPRQTIYVIIAFICCVLLIYYICNKCEPCMSIIEDDNIKRKAWNILAERKKYLTKPNLNNANDKNQFDEIYNYLKEMKKKIIN